MAVLFKIALFFILAYLAARTVWRLLQAVLADPPERQQVPRRERPPRDGYWQGPSPSRSPSAEADVEDARWIDLGNEDGRDGRTG